MSSGPLHPARLNLQPIALQLSSSFPTYRFLGDTWWIRANGSPCIFKSIISTADPISVIPAKLYKNMNLDITPEQNWNAPVPTWHGVQCDIARVPLWWKVPQQPPTFSMHSVLVLLPQHDPPDTLLYAYLGIQFLVEVWGRLNINCSHKAGAPTGLIEA